MAAVGGPKKKLNRADYMFNQLNGVTCVKKPGDIDGIQFAIRYLDGCDASLYDWTSQVSLTHFADFDSTGYGRPMQKL